jgi:hypothetical protein
MGNSSLISNLVDDVESDRLSIFKKESDSMFDQLFFRSDALTRQLSAPLVDEHRQYLAQCLAQGMSKCTLRMKARLLLSIAEYLRLAERPNDTISLPAIKKSRKPMVESQLAFAGKLSQRRSGGSKAVGNLKERVEPQ